MHVAADQVQPNPSLKLNRYSARLRGQLSSNFIHDKTAAY